MKKLSKAVFILILLVIILITSISCSLLGLVDPDDEVPKFVKVNYIELEKIERISKFRSSAGHDYSDSFESCSSMKHYFAPYDTLNWNAIRIYSPVAGKVSRIFEEWAGTQVQIKSDGQPAFTFIIFHIDLENELDVGDKLTEGQLLGTHIGDQTTSDIAVGVNTSKGYKLVSYFDVMTDSLFAAYQARGMNSRTDVIITREEREADPLSCDGESFEDQGTLENWVVLNMP
jgi:hypothetical protein